MKTISTSISGFVKHRLVTGVVAILALGLFSATVQAQVALPFEDHFNYTEGASLGSATGGLASWSLGNSVGSGGPTNRASAALSFPGLGGATGLGVIMPQPGASSRTRGVQFNSGTFGAGNTTLYVSFLVNVQTAPTSMRTLAFLRSSTGSGTPHVGLFLTSTNTLHISKNSTTPLVTPAATLSAGTHLVVLRYKWTSATAGDDEVAIWVDPGSLGVVEGSVPGATQSTTTGSDQSSLVNFSFQQTASDTGVVWIDEVRIASIWSLVTPVDCVVPTQYAVTGGGAYCSGGGGLSVGLANSDTGINYQLKLNGVNVASPLAGTGASLDFGLQTAAGPYSVQGSNTTTTCVGNMSGSVNVTINTAPAITVSPTNKTAFLNGSVSFSVGATGTSLNYQWRRNGVDMSNGGAISGVTTSTLTINPAALPDAATTLDGYDVVITGTCSPAQTSTRVSLAVVPPTDLVWAGDGGANNWDSATTVNFLNGVTPSVFNPGDNVTFDVPATNPVVTLVGTLTPTLVVVKGSANYSFVGSGLIGGSSSLVKSNAGTLTIANTSANSFSGKTLIAGGAVSIAADTALGAAPGAVVADQLTLNGGTLAMTNGFTLAANRGVTLGAGGGTVDISAGSLAYNGILTGSGGLTKSGAGTLALQNVGNNYSGNTVVNAGTLSIDGDATLGTPAGTLQLAGGILSTTADRGTITANPIGNPISLTADSVITTASTASGPILSLTNNSFSGTAGTLTIRNDGADGAADTFVIRLYGTGFDFTRPIILSNGPIGQVSLRAYNADGVQTLSGVISGAGGIHRRSTVTSVSGDTILSGDNTYSGGTTITDGGIGFGTDSTGSPVVTSGPVGTGTITFADSSTASSIRSLFASGGARAVANAILINSVQTNIIKGANTLTLSGTLDLGAGTRALQVDNSSDTILSGVISNGGLTKNGSGRLLLNGVNTYTGITTVNSGTLGGTGTIAGAVTVSAGGTLAPGASIGTLTINGDLTLAGNTSIEVNKTAVTKDLITGVGTLNYGGTLTVANLSGTLTAGDSFVIASATTPVGNFSSIVGSPGAGLNWSFNPATGTLSVVSGAAPTLGVSQAGNALTFSWAGAYKLQSQTNGLSAGSWFDYPGGGSSPIGVTINPANGSVFFRLINQ